MFSSPIAGTPGKDFFYGSYRDHGGNDYHCSFKWYAGHQGTDILIRNFRVQDSGVAVIAASPGTVTVVRDGLPDRNTVSGPGGFGNHVVVEHAGGPLATYGHLRMGSVRVAVNQAVRRGDTLGLVGSSGNSNWPHLHFEVSDAGLIVDPFIGSCNAPVSQPTWLDQLAWQGEFAVMDAGLSRPPVSYGELLGRPADLGQVNDATGDLVFWASLHNVQAPSTRTVLLDSAGTVLAQVATGPVTTFSARFLVSTFSLSALRTPGTHAVALLMPTPMGSELEVVRRTFVYNPGLAAVRGPGAGPSPPTDPKAWLSPSAGDRP